MADWLTPAQAQALVGLDSAEVSESDAFDGAVEAAQAYVERKRRDLAVAADPDADPPVEASYTPTPDVLLGAAMLANRLYQRRTSPLGAAQYTEFGSSSILRYDPDIARLLGIGSEGGFFFGSAKPPTATDAESIWAP